MPSDGVSARNETHLYERTEVGDEVDDLRSSDLDELSKTEGE